MKCKFQIYEIFTLDTLNTKQCNNSLFCSYLAVIFAFLTLMHIFANYKAIHGLTFKHLNLPRFLIVFNNYLKYDAVANPTVVNKAESIFFPSLIKTGELMG